MQSIYLDIFVHNVWLVVYGPGASPALALHLEWAKKHIDSRGHEMRVDGMLLKSTFYTIWSTSSAYPQPGSNPFK